MRYAKLVGMAAAGMLGAACGADVLVGTNAGRFLRLNVDTGAMTQIRSAPGNFCIGFGWRGGELTGLRYVQTLTPTHCDLVVIDPATGTVLGAEISSIGRTVLEGSTYYSIGMTGLADGSLLAFEYQTAPALAETLVSRTSGEIGFEPVGFMGVANDGGMGGDPLGRVWTTSGIVGSSFMEVDAATGAARVVATIPGGVENMYAMVFDRGVLYGIGEAGSIYEINRGTGEIRFLRRVQGLRGPEAIYSAAGEHPLCLGDLNSDGFVDFFDYSDFVTAFEAGTLAADVNADGFIDFFDYATYVEGFEAGC